MITKRHALVLLASALLTRTAKAQARWPDRPVRLITPSQPGGSPDVVARVFGEGLSKLWSQSVIVENRPGADGVIAVQALREAALQDGPIPLLVASTSVLTVTPALREALPFDPIADILPVSTAAADFLAVAVPAASAISSLDDLQAAIKARENEVNWFAVPGGPFMVVTDWLRTRALQPTFVPYRGAPDAIRDLAAGRIQVAMTPLAPLTPLIQSGQVRVLAVTNPERSPVLPLVPTAIESGHADLALEGLIGVFAASNLNADRRRSLAADMATAALSSEVGERLRKGGQVVRTSTPDGLGRILDEQTARWHKLARQQGASAVR
jgi:tripartite-type tricarboxylate transporter receptor subunit TctC